MPDSGDHFHTPYVSFRPERLDDAIRRWRSLRDFDFSQTIRLRLCKIDHFLFRVRRIINNAAWCRRLISQSAVHEATTAGASLDSRPSSRPLIAPAWHTIVFIAIFVGISVVGGFFQHAVKQHPQAIAPSGNAVSGYISVLVFEWLLVLYVRMGVHKRGVRLRDLIGGRWATPQAVMKDIALGAGLWAVWMGLMNAHILGGGTNAAQGLLPQGILESLAWLPLALSAGFCEELAFRGYLQKQFQVITGSAAWAVLIQAVVFGIGHLYEGVGPVVRIMLFGVLFGLLALWQKSLRPGMIAHAWSDIFGVIIFRGM